MKKALQNLFLKGLTIWLPIAALIGVVIWTAVSAETYLGAVVKLFIPNEWYKLGFGILFGIILISAVSIIIGKLAQFWVAQKFLSLFNSFVEWIPLLKFVYRTLHNLIDCIDPSNKKQLGKPAKIYKDATKEGSYQIGFVTHKDCTGIRGLNDPDRSMVYVSFSLNMGGQPYLIPKSWIEYIEDATSEEMLVLAMSAGLAAGNITDINKTTKNQDQ